MTREKAKKTFGTKLKRGSVYVARLTNIDPPEMTREDKEVTDHDSPDETKEYIPGLKEGGEVSIEGNLIPTDDTQEGLAAAFHEQDPETWTIEFKTVPKLYIEFEGYVNAFKVGPAPVDGTLTFTSKIKVTGTPEIKTDESLGLSALVVTGALALDLMPAFDNETYEYFVVAPNTDATVTVTPTQLTNPHTITVNGATVVSGEASGAIALTAEATTEITVKAAETGKAPVVYVLKVFREGAL